MWTANIKRLKRELKSKVQCLHEAFTQGFCFQSPLKFLCCPSVSLGSSKASVNGFHSSSLLPYFCFGLFLVIYGILQNLFHQGSNFPQNLSKMLFGCLSILYFLIISVTGTNNWERSYWYLLCSDSYQSLTKTPQKRFFLKRGAHTCHHVSQKCMDKGVSCTQIHGTCIVLLF